MLTRASSFAFPTPFVSSLRLAMIVLFYVRGIIVCHPASCSCLSSQNAVLLQ